MYLAGLGQDVRNRCSAGSSEAHFGGTEPPFDENCEFRSPILAALRQLLGAIVAPMGGSSRHKSNFV